MSCLMRTRSLFAMTAVCLVMLPMLLAKACLNDRDSDSLAVEGGKLPHVISVITGRFERNPPLFYQMRLARVSREIAAHPTTWKLYDDAAVACDRLHDDTAALRWIEKKCVGMERAHVTTATPDGKDAWYRYHANAGTFHAHRFLQNGAKPEQLDEMDQGIKHIEQALALNPNAHFGRERYQLGAMRWIAKVKRGEIDPKKSRYEGILPEATSDIYPSRTDSYSGKSPYDFTDAQTRSVSVAATEGLSGLIVLGNAWESVDVFAALAQSLAGRGDAKVGYLAQLRCQELLQKGRRSFDTSATGSPADVARTLSRYQRSSQLGRLNKAVTNEANLGEKFAELRTEADHWQTKRTEYLLSRLKVGQHPDTVSDFWKDFRSAPAPALDIEWHKEAEGSFGNWLMLNAFSVFLGFIAFFVVGCPLLWFFVKYLIRLVAVKRPPR